ncbi:hypothetical protein RYX36_010674 [Vicia faba]
MKRTRFCKKANPYNVQPVKEFYANLVDTTSKRLEVKVQGMKFSYSEEDIAEKPKKSARKDKKPKKVNTTIMLMIDSFEKEFDINKPYEKEGSSDDGRTMNEMMEQTNKDKVELQSEALVEMKDEGNRVKMLRKRK